MEDAGHYVKEEKGADENGVGDDTDAQDEK